MDWIIHWILRAVSLFVLAVVKGKRKPVKKQVKRRALTARTRGKKATRPARRPRRRAPRSKPATTPARRPPPSLVTPVAAPKAVAAEPPPKPVPPIGRAILLSPGNDKLVDNLHPTFRWLSVGGATRYEIAWSEDPSLSSSHTIFSIATETAVPAEKPLRFGKTYYWRVRGGNESGWGPWSVIASFRVMEETT